MAVGRGKQWCVCLCVPVCVLGVCVGRVYVCVYVCVVGRERQDGGCWGRVAKASGVHAMFG